MIDTDMVIDIKTVGPGRPFGWLKQGLVLFIKAPLVWLVFVLALGIVTFVAQKIPFLGALIEVFLGLIVPGLLAGLMIGCRALQQGGSMSFDHLMAGFRKKPVGLFMLGVLNTLCLTGIAIAALSLSSTAITPAQLGAMLQGETPMAMNTSTLVMLLITSLLSATLFTLLAMLVTFAIPLLALRPVSFIAAVNASFKGSLKNILPFLVYGMILLPLAVAVILVAYISGLPPGLIAPLLLLVLLPISIPAIYAAYQDIFE